MIAWAQRLLFSNHVLPQHLDGYLPRLVCIYYASTVCLTSFRPGPGRRGCDSSEAAKIRACKIIAFQDFHTITFILMTVILCYQQ